MTVLRSYFSYGVEQNPEKREDFVLKKTRGENGEEITIEAKVNYKEIQENNGTVDLWDTERMQQAGINVKGLTPHTSDPTRAEGLENVKDAASKFVEKVKEDVKKSIK